MAARAWRRTADQALSAYGISSSSALPLLTIGRLGERGVRQITLAQEVGIEGPSLVRVLDHLCASNLARRDEDPADGRAKIVSLTDAGREMVQRIEGHLSELRSRLLEGVSDDELHIALRVIHRFAQEPAPAASASSDSSNGGHSGDDAHVDTPASSAS